MVLMIAEFRLRKEALFIARLQGGSVLSLCFKSSPEKWEDSTSLVLKGGMRGKCIKRKAVIFSYTAILCFGFRAVIPL